MKDKKCAKRRKYEPCHHHPQKSEHLYQVQLSNVEIAGFAVNVSWQINGTYRYYTVLLNKANQALPIVIKGTQKFTSFLKLLAKTDNSATFDVKN